MTRTVYFVSNGSAIKIGTTACLRSRLASLSCGSPSSLSVILTIDGGHQHEKTIHNELAAYRLNGEWFRDCPEVRDAIDRYKLHGVKPTGPNKDRTVRSHQLDSVSNSDDTFFKIDLHRLPMVSARSAALKTACKALEEIVAETKRKISLGEDVSDLKAKADFFFKEARI